MGLQRSTEARRDSTPLLPFRSSERKRNSRRVYMFQHSITIQTAREDGQSDPKARRKDFVVALDPPLQCFNLLLVSFSSSLFSLSPQAQLSVYLLPSSFDSSSSTTGLAAVSPTASLSRRTRLFPLSVFTVLPVRFSEPGSSLSTSSFERK